MNYEHTVFVASSNFCNISLHSHVDQQMKQDPKTAFKHSAPGRCERAVNDMHGALTGQRVYVSLGILIQYKDLLCVCGHVRIRFKHSGV